MYMQEMREEPLAIAITSLHGHQKIHRGIVTPLPRESQDYLCPWVCGGQASLGCSPSQGREFLGEREREGRIGHPPDAVQQGAGAEPVERPGSECPHGRILAAPRPP